MPAPSTARDPRSIVTPEAFHVAPDLLGLPLASPRRRLAAILLDLVFVGILTFLTRSFALVLGAVVAAALLRTSRRRTEVRGNVFDRARRLSIGCLGLGIGSLTFLMGTALWLEDVVEEPEVTFIEDGAGIAIGLEADGIEELMEPRDVDAIRDGVTLYTTEQALDAYAELLRSGSDTETDRELRLALEARLAEEVASDALGALRDRVARLEDDLLDEEANEPSRSWRKPRAACSTASWACWTTSGSASGGRPCTPRSCSRRRTDRRWASGSSASE
jgi:hypothetical protein